MYSSILFVGVSVKTACIRIFFLEYTLEGLECQESDSVTVTFQRDVLTLPLRRPSKSETDNPFFISTKQQLHFFFLRRRHYFHDLTDLDNASVTLLELYAMSAMVETVCVETQSRGTVEVVIASRPKPH